MSATLLLDRGNRSLKAVLAGPDGSLGERMETEREDGALVRRLSAGAGRAVFSCVLPAARPAILAALAEAGVPVVEAGAERRLPFPVLVERPGRLGADRIAAACGAAALGLAEAVIVDAGTAVTVDCLSARGFLGGAIFPGPALLRVALHRGTGALPEIRGPGEAPRYPGTSTEEAIAAGIGIGLAGAVRGIVDRAGTLLSPGAPVLLTGGAAGIAGADIDPPPRAVPDLVFRGLLLIGELNDPE